MGARREVHAAGSRRRGSPRLTARSGPVLRLRQSRAAAPGVGLPDPGGGLRDAGAWRSQAIPAGERGIIWMRAALAPIPDRVTSHRAPSLGHSPGTVHGRPTASLSMNDVTRILSAIEQGDPHAAEQLLPLVYDELRKLAAAAAGPGEARPDAPGHRPGPRGLPPAGRRRSRRSDWNGRGHFFAAAAEAMRRILVDNARRKRRAQARRRPAAASTSTTLDRRRRPPPTTCSPWTRPSTGWPRDDPVKRRAGQAPLLRRPDASSEAAAAPRHLAAAPPTATGPTPAPGCYAALDGEADGDPRRIPKSLAGDPRAGTSHCAA